MIMLIIFNIGNDILAKQGGGAFGLVGLNGR